MEQPTRGGGGPAPELAVQGNGLSPVTLAGLSAGGGALLVFVSEHCPTSALVPKWASPEAIVLLVAGGEAGRYSAVLGPCTGMGSAIVSREVESRGG
jgi:hypothetical protein